MPAIGFPQRTHVIPVPLFVIPAVIITSCPAPIITSFPQHTQVIPAAHPRHSRVGGNLDARYCGIR